MLWLGLHFPWLALEAVTAAEPDQPRVVVDNGRVMLCNEAAIEARIALGSTLATAHSIVPGLLYYRRDLQAEQQRLTLLAEVLYGFSPRVCLAREVNGIALEIGGSLRLFGDAHLLGERIETVCEELGHRVRIRLGSTALAALILARSDAPSLGDVPLRQAAVEPERLSTERLERLANMGIHTFRQLAGLPASGLARRLGADLVDYVERITGARPDPRATVRPAEQFLTTLHLLEPLRDKQALLFPVRRLLTDLEHWLVARQLGAEQLRWHFGANGDWICMPVRFARARQRREAFLDITRLELESIELPEDVIDLRLEAHRLVPWSAGSHGLFTTLPNGHELEDASGLVDQLRARLGHDACYSLESADQHAPEQAWQRVSPLGRRRAQTSPTRRRPLWLFDPPRTITQHELTLLRGPERIHTGWWCGQGQARDYYVARHRNGAECWVFVDPAERWFLHGYFA